MQYIISIGLVIGTLTIHAQLKLTQKKGECYRNLIEIGSWKGGKLDVNTFAAELKNRPEIASVTRAGGSSSSPGSNRSLLKTKMDQNPTIRRSNTWAKKISCKP